MVKALLSIDWDYFIPIKREWCGSYFESKKNVQALWYKRYFKCRENGENIIDEVKVGVDLNEFWKKIKGVFSFDKNIKIYMTDSHKWSYNIAKNNGCNTVFNIDAHSDLGYEGLNSLMFEVNCSNWFGKLFGDNIINKGYVIYSPYTYENKDEFKEINNKFAINYCNVKKINSKIDISTIHICRSGMWTPPWLDYEFYKFCYGILGNHIIKYCPTRNWNVESMTLSEKLDYLYCS